MGPRVKPKANTKREKGETKQQHNRRELFLIVFLSPSMCQMTEQSALMYLVFCSYREPVQLHNMCLFQKQGQDEMDRTKTGAEWHEEG